MWVYCEACGHYVKMQFVAEYEDDAGRKWEVYECTFCGERKRYAVG